MPLFLSSLQKEEILTLIKKSFSEFRFFETLCLQPVRNLIEDSTRIDFSKQFIASLLERYVNNLSSYESKEEKELLYKLRVILTTTAIYLLSMKTEITHSTFYPNTEKLLENYPKWRDRLDLSKREDQMELEFLLKFRNFMSLALQFVSPINNKIFLLRVVERLEGSNNEYITGTGQKEVVTRRATDIFHQESGVKMKTTKDETESQSLSPTSSSNPSPTLKRKKEELGDNTPDIKNQKRRKRREEKKQQQKSVHFAQISSSPQSILPRESEISFEVDAETESNLFQEGYPGSFTEDLKNIFTF